MGQFIAIHGRNQAEVEQLGERALSLFEEIAGLRVSALAKSPCCIAAKFPKIQAQSSKISNSENGLWLFGIGTWFYGRASGAQALNQLRESTRNFHKLDEPALRELDGSFALCFQNPRQDGFSIITDRVGTLHVYIRQIGECTLASSSSAVLAALGPCDWDSTSCREFLGMGTVFEDRTLFRGTTKLPPSVVWSCGDERHSTTKYWDLHSHLFDRAPDSGDVPRLAEALTDSVAIVASNYSRPIFDLTGGYDSRAVVAAALKAGCDISTVVNGPGSSPDVVSANRIAKELGFRHLHQDASGGSDLWNRTKTAAILCDGEYNALEYANTLAHHSALARKFDISVNGSNGEICKGYWWELLAPRTGAKAPLDSRMVAARRFVYDTWASGLLADAESTDLVSHFADVIARANAELQGYPNTAQMDNVYLTLRMQRWQGRIASATNRIWPCISPFMFRAPMELALSAPPRVRLRNRMAARLIEHLNPKLAALPLAQGYPALPLRPTTIHRFGPKALEILDAVRRRLARNFGAAPAPRAHNSAAGLWSNEEFCELLQPRQMATRELYDPEKLSRFVEASRGSGFSGGKQLGRVITLELLARAVRRQIPYQGDSRQCVTWS